MVKILALAGSLSKTSVNKKLIKWALPRLEAMGHQVTYLELNDYPLPIYCQDIPAEEFPKNAIELDKIIQEHQVLLFSIPENNYSMTACFKNAIDWISRAPENKPNFQAFANKIIGLMSASPSNFGGFRSLRAVREMLSMLGCFVLPAQACVPSAHTAFDGAGNLSDEISQKAVKDVLEQLSITSLKLLA